jgi:hypothetical protein
MIPKVVTLKWGKRYGPEYVNRLAAAVKRHTRQPVEIVCFTDDAEGIADTVTIHPIPEIDLPPEAMVCGWRKLCLFRNDLPVDGVGLFLDLDILITGPLDDFFSFGEPDQIPIIHNWVPWHKKLFRPDPQIGNSSVFRFLINQSDFIWEQFHREKEWALATFRPPQSYLTHCIRTKMVYWPDAWVRSFKRHCRPTFPANLMLAPRLPSEARIIAFHGKPDPEEAVGGYKGAKPHHHTRPCAWISQHWSD